MSEELVTAFDASSEGLQLLAILENRGAITETSLVLPPDTPFDTCEALAGMLGQLHRMNPWLIGDLLLHVERVYNETYAQAAEATGLAPQTLINYTSTCNRVPRSRRRKKVPFSIHSEIAWLEPKEQEDWLRRVSREDWPRERVREELAPLRAAKRLERLKGKGLDAVPVSAVPDRSDNANGGPGPLSADVWQTTDLVRHSGIPEHVPVITVDGVEVLPPALGSPGHICHCVICGRAHRSDRDVSA